MKWSDALIRSVLCHQYISIVVARWSLKKHWSFSAKWFKRQAKASLFI